MLELEERVLVLVFWQGIPNNVNYDQLIGSHVVGSLQCSLQAHLIK